MEPANSVRHSTMDVHTAYLLALSEKNPPLPLRQKRRFPGTSLQISSVSLQKLTPFVFSTPGFQPWEEDRPHSFWFEYKVLAGTCWFHLKLINWDQGKGHFVSMQ